MADVPPDRSDFRKAFAEMLGSGRTYLARCLVILILLIVVVEDRLVTLRGDGRRVDEEILNLDRQLVSAKAAVGSRRAAIQRQYIDLLRCTKLVPEGLDQTFLDGLADTPGHYDPGGAELKIVEEMATALRSRAGKLLPKERSCQKEALVGPNAPGRLTALASDLTAYVRDYRTNTRLWNERNLEKKAKLTEKTQLTNRSSSIPTPFGGFDVIPGLALVGLGFGTFGSYLGVRLSIRRAHALARRFRSIFGATETITIGDPAPFWLYTADRSADATLGWEQPGPRAFLSTAFHAGWVAAMAFLVWQARTFDAVAHVVFLPETATTIALYATVPVGALLAGLLLSPRPEAASRLTNQHRRQLLRVASAAALVGLAFLVFRTTFRPSAFRLRQRPNRKGVRGQDVWDFRTEFVGNPATLTLHHVTDGTRLARPVKGEDIPAAEFRDYFVHKGSRALMRQAQVLLGEATAAQTDVVDRAFSLMVTALKANPDEFDLSDRFLAACGKWKRYDVVNSYLEGLEAGPTKAVLQARWASAARRHAKAAANRARARRLSSVKG